MNVKVELEAIEIRQAISDYIQEQSGVYVSPTDITVQVKSKQNYRSEWEEAEFRCSFQAVSKEKR